MGLKLCGRVNPDNASPLSAYDLELLVENTGYGKEEVLKFYKGFLKDCPCGYLNRRRLKQFYRSLFPGCDPSTFVKTAFAAFDTNRDGKISFAEFITAISIIKSDDLSKQLGLAFDIFDMNKNGMLTEQEITHVLKCLYDMRSDQNNGFDEVHRMKPEQKAKEIMTNVHPKHQGNISKDEFIEFTMEDETIKMLFGVQSQPCLDTTEDDQSCPDTTEDDQSCPDTAE